MKEWKLQDPRIEETDNSVVVTLPHVPLARPEQLVMEFLAKHDQITNKQGREITGIRSENKMKEVFYRLRDNNKIELHPELKGPASAGAKPVPTLWASVHSMI
jgi:ATP-dependent DNA helicase RecG